MARCLALAATCSLIAAHVCAAEDGRVPLNSLFRKTPAETSSLVIAPLPTNPIAQALETAAWMSAASYPVRVAHYGFAQNGNVLYVIGGFVNGFPTDAFRSYDATTNTWSTLASLPVATESPVAVYYKNKIYLADGYGPASQNLLRIYDVATNAWAEGLARPGVIDSYGSAIGAYNDKIYLVGGGSSGSTPLVSVYDIATSSWSSGPLPPQPFYFGGYTQIGSFLYLVGGFSPTAYVNSTVTMRFDLATGTWTTGPAFTPQRGDFALAAAGTKLFAMGGDADGGDYFNASAEVDELDTAAWPGGSWNLSPPFLPAPRLANQGGFFTTALTGGEIWTTGGYAVGIGYTSDHLFRPVPHGAPTPVSAVSRMSHGAAGNLDVVLPLSGTPAVECRSGGPTRDYLIVVNFAGAVSVTGTPQAKVTRGSGFVGQGGTANGGAVTVAGSSVSIPLTNVGNAQVLNVTLSGTTDGGDAGDITIPLRILLGDINGDASVNSADVAQARARSGQPVTSATFRADTNRDGIINSADVFIARSASGSSLPAPQPVSAFSRKIHGNVAIDLPLPLTGASGIECRAGGVTGDYEIVVNFAVPVWVNGTPQAVITSGSAAVGSAGAENGGGVNVNGSTVIIPLTNVANAQSLTVTLLNVTDSNGSGEVSIPLRLLIGDANGDGTVNSADAALARNRSGQAVTPTTFRADLNADGVINSADYAILRSRSGSSLPNE